MPEAYYKRETLQECDKDKCPPLINNLRKDEKSAASAQGENGEEFTVAYSTTAYSVREAAINLGRTSFICVVLSIAAITFTKGAQDMVLEPLERMIEKVKMIAKNNEAGLMSFMKKKDQK